MSSRATRKANRKAARSEISECSVCLQVFPNQAERDRHTQSDHPEDASGSFYIPVERFKPKRVPNATNDKNPTEWVTEPMLGLTTRTPNAGHEGRKQNVIYRPDRRGHRSNPVHSSDSRDRGGKQVPDWGRGYHTSQPSQPTPDPKQPNIGLTGDMDSPYDGSRVGHIGPSAFAQTPESSATRSSVEVVGIRTPITHPAPVQPYCSTCTQAFPNQAAIEYHLIFCPTPIDQPFEQSSPLPPDTKSSYDKSSYTKCYTYPSVDVAVSNSTSNHGKRTGTPPPINLDGFPRLRPPRLASMEDCPAPAPVLRCERCKHDFPTQRALDLHFRNSIIHAPENHCSQCSLHFSTQGALVAHSVTVHGLELSCDQCDCWFAAEGLRAAHVRSAHQKPIAAPVPARSKRSSNGSEGVWAGLFKSPAAGSRRTPQPLQPALAKRRRPIRDVGDMAGSGTTPGPLQPKPRKLGRAFRDAGDT